MSSTVKILAVVLVLGLAVAGCQTMTGRTAGSYFDDKTTTGSIKGKLVADHAANLTSVGVDTVNGVVYLTGVAETPEHRLRAEQLAWQTTGVRQVVNNIQVQRPPVVIGAPAAGAASPATQVLPRTVTGTVASVDPVRNQVTVRSGNEQLLLQLPAGVVSSIRPGDEITVNVNVRPAR